MVIDAHSRKGIPDATIATVDQKVESDTLGNFGLKGIGPGALLTISAPGYGGRNFTTSETALRDGKPIRIFLSRGFALRGSVVSESGDAVKTAIVTAIGLKADLDFQQDAKQARCDAEGQFEFLDLRRDIKYSVAVDAQGFGMRSIEVLSPPSNEDSISVPPIVLSPQGFVRGIVRQNGDACQNIWVSISGWDDRQQRLENSKGIPTSTVLSTRRVLTDENGEFQFSRIARGNYQVNAKFTSGRKEKREVWVQDGSVSMVEFNYSKPAAFRGRVVDWQTGAGIKNAKVKVLGTSHKPSLTTNDGYFKVEDVRRTSFELKVQIVGQGYQQTIRRLIEDRNQMTVIEARKVKRTSGHATLPNGTPVANASVVVMRGPLRVANGKTDNHGAFSVDIPVGADVQVRVRHPQSNVVRVGVANGIRVGQEGLVVTIPD